MNWLGCSHIKIERPTRTNLNIQSEITENLNLFRHYI